MKNNSEGRNQVLGDVHFLESTGHDFVKSAQLLFENHKNNTGEYFNSIALLASQAVELLPKALIALDICLEMNNGSAEDIHCAINKKLSRLGHDLNCIFCNVPELERVLKISNIERINCKNNTEIYIDEFLFKIDKGQKQKLIRIKNLEGARYGLFAKNKDVGACSQEDIKNVVDFLKKLSEETRKIKINMIDEFDKK